MQTAPYGSWTSPITAADLVASAHPVSGGRYVGDSEGGQVWWTEQRPDQAGRQAVRRFAADGRPEDVLPPPWNARTRVHEYGGSSWTATGDGVLLFTEFTDQRLYRLVPGGEAEPLTPTGAVQAGLRYAEPQVSADGTEVWCVRESHHSDGSIRRDICAVPLDGSAAEDPARIRSVVSGSHFLAYPRVSPDGSKLAWIAWEHPQMPWDGTELRVADLTDGTCGPARTLLGSTTESVLQPEWADNDSLFVISDSSGWWNLYRMDLAEGAAPRPLCPLAEDFAGALWVLGLRWYAPLADGRLLAVHTLGQDRLGLLDPATGELTDLDLAGLSTLALNGITPSGGRALLTSGGARVGTGLRELDLATGTVTDLRLNNDQLPPADYLPAAQPMTFPGPGGREVHAFVYPPTNPDFEGPDGELPPYVAFVHGGPTSRVSPLVNLAIAYLASRGVGVVDVNYGGSTAYGRAYRDRLRGQWGIVDVEDTVAVVQGLVDAGMADGNRLAIEGGSAGGWTVLSALTGTKVFACGVSYFGVAELVKFAEDTHDFESRYLDGLIGPLPEALPLYQSRAPLSKVDQLSCPVLLLQGLDDPVVPPSQSEMFRDALVAKGIPHAYLAYAGESHGFRRAETQINAVESALSFYGQVFGFEPAGVPVLKLWRPEDAS